MNEKQINIAIVDDQALFRQGLIALFAYFPQIHILLEAENGIDLKEKLKTRQPEIILLDLEMPEMDGKQTTLFLQKEYPHIKIIILTMHNENGVIKYFAEQGVNGFLLKDSSIEEIVDALYVVTNNGYYFNETVSKALVKGLIQNKSIKPVFSIVDLSAREIEVLKLVCEEKSNQEIAEKLFIDVKTAAKHKENIIKKTNSKNIIGAVMYAVKNKLM